MNVLPLLRGTPRRLARALPWFATLALLAACSPRPAHEALAFPADTAIAGALRSNFESDPDSARARELVATLGGAQGTVDYGIRRVVWRQGSYEVQYDVHLRMGQNGADSLRGLYAQMIPAEAVQKLPQQTQEAYVQWLRAQADGLDKSAPQQAARLRASLDSLDACYAKAKAGDAVTLMTGLGALLSPERSGWYVERLQAPGMQLRCLPV